MSWQNYKTSTSDGMNNIVGAVGLTSFLAERK